MANNDNIPTGADTRQAPWNEPDKEEAYFTCQVTETLIKKNVPVPTKMYDMETEINDDGLEETFLAPCKEVDWEKEYEAGCFTIQEMLSELEKYVEHDISMTGKNTNKGRYLQRLLKACRGWETYDTQVECNG